MKNVNFIFLRHGFACHNVTKTIGLKTASTEIIEEITDAQLTDHGVDVAKWMGCLIKNIIKVIHKINLDDPIDDIEKIHIVGCSPLIRSMETAYYMTDKWLQKPEKIYVFPYLRELDERIFQNPNINKYEDLNIYKVPGYAMKSINQQKRYLKNTLHQWNKIDFSFVDGFENERQEPGDINIFIEWFYDNVLRHLNTKQKIFNVLIVTHSGVLRDHFKELNVPNYLGYILQTHENERNEIKMEKYVSIEELFEKADDNFSIDLSYTVQNICGIDQKRCTEICKKYNQENQKPLVKREFKPECNEMSEEMSERSEEMSEETIEETSEGKEKKIKWYEKIFMKKD